VRKLSTLTLAATAATAIGVFAGPLASADTPDSAKVGCGLTKLVVAEGQCTYYPTSKSGRLTVSGTGHADVVCSGGGYAQLTSTGGTKSTTFERAVDVALAPCVLSWAGVGSFSA
jgi:hypothetical protein